MNQCYSPNNLKIRRALLGDITQMVHVEQESGAVFSEMPFDFLSCLPENLPLHSKEFYERAVRNNGAWLAELDSEVIGFICAENIEDESSIHISEFAVDYNHQRKGIGNQLISFVINYAKNANKHLTLTTFSNVPWNAKYYRKLGFITLKDHELNDRLKLVLEHEVKIGLPQQYRCAMKHTA
ncbi:GNAT family N-acetyltransferase [Photobacterium sp. J15]|uniref:GNAT family N-acetyltransferase n=1 Tax=Photobacterium sp. J15 TaxID=265901 RepID=UPI0009FF8E10|nr:GNAT family N-acetyltransferase [Photobacterium sp. J15]